MADRWWVNDDADNNFSGTNNWSATEGGAGGASIPGAADNAYFSATSSTANCTLSANISVATLKNRTAETGGTDDWAGQLDANNFNITSGDFITSAGSSYLGGTGTWSISGQFQMNGTFTRETSTILLTGTTQFFRMATGTAFNDITVTGSYSWATGYGHFDVYGTLDVQGTFTNDSANTCTMKAGSNITCSGTMDTSSTGKITLDGTAQVTAHSGTISIPVRCETDLAGTYTPLIAGAYGDVTFAPGGASTAITYRLLAGSYTFADMSAVLFYSTPVGTVDLVTNNPSVTITGDVIVDAQNTWSKGTGTITASGTANQSWDFNAETVEDIDIDKTAGVVTLTGNVSPDTLLVTDGTLDIDANSITTTGVVTAAAGTTVQDTTGGGLITCGGNFASNGTSPSPNVWNGPDLTITGTATASWTTATNSDASGGTQVTATDSTDGTGNTNWDFGAVTLDQTRMSTFNIGMPWRSGSMVNPLDTGFTAANRQASGFMYAGIIAQAPGGATLPPLLEGNMLIGGFQNMSGGL